MPEVACLGDLNVDVLLYVDNLPSLGGESLASRVEIRPGGAAANVSVALARLGAASTFIGAVGDDAFGRMLREDLNREGVDTSFLATIPGEVSGFMAIFVTRDGERTIVGYRGANRKLSPACLAPGALKEVKALFVSGYAFLESPQREAALRAIGLAREEGALVAVDVSEPLAAKGWESFLELVGEVDMAFMNEREAELFSRGERLSRLLGKVFELAIVKMGARGASLISPEGEIHVKAFKIKAVDTTGAGDAFDAGFLYGILRGLSREQALVLANAVAAWKCTGVGSRHLPTREQVAEFLEARGFGGLASTLRRL